VTPDDLMRYGMIPELVGRLPVTVSVDPLDLDALRAILTRPRNALVRQYQRLFEMDDVHLEFDPAALEAAASLALQRETGARGLRAIIESALLRVMYEIPSHREVRRVTVDEAVMREGTLPQMLDAEGNPIPLEPPSSLSDAA
jgi:ATP-dependent Clp protease ATP-binding subunit ClpX